MKLDRWLLVALFSLTPLFSQDTATLSQPSTQTILLTIDAQPSKPLTNSDILVSVDKGAFTPVSTLQSASNAPLDFILVVDSSLSATRSPIWKAALREVAAFVTSLRASGISVRTAVVGFTATPWVAQNLTSDPIEGSLEHLTPSGGSSLYDALTIGSRIADQSPAPNRRLIFVVSDGEDNQSHITQDEAAQAAIRSRTQINSLSLGEPPRQYAPIPGLGDKTLRFLTSETGGKAYFPVDEKDVRKALEAFRSDIQQEYFVAVQISVGFHKLRFKTSITHGVIHGPSKFIQ